MSEQFWAVAASLLAGLVLGGLGRVLLRSRIRLSWSDAVVAGLIGAAVGALFVGLVRDVGGQLPVIAGLVTVGATLLVLLAMERWQARRRLPQGSIAELIRGGETGQVEFKSSARYNRHSGKRDERLELVVAKTLAALLNAEGGVLLIGVADDGSVTGIEDDYPLLKRPTPDAFELWLRDLVIKTLGTHAATSIHVEIAAVEGRDVCKVTCARVTRPVFLRTAKGQPAQLYARIGNSTRELDVEEALAYCRERWGGWALRSGRRGAPGS